ncbi:DUF3558 domain-containing protein [Amycolatopsis sp. DR6-1]|uniref:DUF3558 domain-containing protein n=2 Tax=Amycolatopsis dendrobii TaxID=2760662 RepID=A0A7W3ZDM5_9PSEU|nr:DUF3558 domain-containing protein [Amycolatopsis dendrobii]
MMRRLPPALLVAAVIVALGTACGGRPAPAPPASPAPATSAANALPHSGAPKVEHPLPASALSGNPCETALTADQVERIISVAPAGKLRNIAGLGPSCWWSNIDSGSAVSTGYVTEDRQGLSAVYHNSKPKSKLWRPLPPVQGFPAVAFRADLGDDLCQVSVGTADDLSVDVTITLGESKKGNTDSCTVAGQAADMVIANLRRRAGS